MQMSQATPPGDGVDGCADQRANVASLCDAAHQSQAVYASSTEQVRRLHRDLVSAEHQSESARSAAEPQRRSEEKARARKLYEHASELAVTDAEIAEATANWARALDRINRTGRLAERSVAKTKATVTALNDDVIDADRAEQRARLEAQTAEAACLEARVRLAACDEQAQAVTMAAVAPASVAPPPATASVFDPHAATGDHATMVPKLPRSEPLVIEVLLMGDRRTLELTGARIAEHTGLQPAEAILQLQELVDAIVSVASGEGYLVFEDGHPFWSHLSVDEARDVIAALARLGFQFEPTEGWHAGRSPTSMDLSMALAYAGLDARNMRDLPNIDELRSLPQSISVDARSFLAATAPDLAVDHMVGILDHRAAQLEPLWNEWGQVRPILLSDRQTLGQLVR
jgi:hypothetical protein